MLRAGHDHARPLLVVDGAADALIEEARRRRRRRWRRRGMVAGLLVVAGLAVGVFASRGGSLKVVRESTATPFANLAGFSGRGELAFISRGTLWVMDGATQTLRRLPVPAGFRPASPLLSYDGHWLAYLALRPNNDGNNEVEVWVSRGDGSEARMVVGPSVYQLVGWSPTADVIALTTYRTEPFAPYPAVTRLVLVSPPDSLRTLVDLRPARARPDSIWSAVWSPDGRQLAVSTTGALTRVLSYPVTGGSPTNWFSIRNDQPFPVRICSACGGGNEVIADLVGWWPRRGIGFWVYCCGAVHDNDGSPLAVLARPEAQPRVLNRTLSSRTTDAMASASNGALAIVADATNAGREIGDGKTVETCPAATNACSAIPGATTWVGPDHQRCVIPTQSPRHCLGLTLPRAGRPGSGVSLDPSWSPNGELLAYVRAPVALTGGWPDAAWYAAHALYLWNAQTGATRRIGAIEGASVPTWSADGHDLLYVHDDDLWLAPVDSGKPTELAGPLFSSSGLYASLTNDYYGQIPWSAQFSWWPR